MITRKDVAKYAGVSETTVTRVLSSRGYVSKENIDKVNEAVKVLGYHPNMVAQGLRTKKTYQIIFHAPELSNPFFAEIYNGINDYVQPRGFHIVVNGNFNQNSILQRQYDGVILPYYQNVKEYMELDVPIVLTNFSKENVNIPHVNVDIESGFVEALNYLYECGHRKIALVTLDIVYNQRTTAYMDWLKEKGLNFEPSLFITNLDGKSNFEQGYNLAVKMAKEGTNATAIIAFNDAMAIGMIGAFEEKGVRIPEDISVIGFDDIVQARFTNPALTTIRTPLYDIGTECAQMLIKAIGGETTSTKTLSTKLVIRKSVANI